MMGRTFCPLGDAAAMPTLGFVKKFRKEFEEYRGRLAPRHYVDSWSGRIEQAGSPTWSFAVFSAVGRASTRSASAGFGRQAIRIDARRNLHRRRQEAHRTRGHAADRGLQDARASRSPRSATTRGCRCRPRAACAWCGIEKMPKLQTACTTPVAEGMVVTDRVRRRSRRPARPRCNCCWATIRWTARCAMRAASASCRT